MIPRTKKIEIGGHIDLVIKYDEIIHPFPIRKEDFFGITFHNEDDVEIRLNSVDLIIGNYTLDILGGMNLPMKEEIIELLKD